VTTIEDPDVATVARISAVPTILRVIGQTTGLRLTLIARVTDDMWKACAVHDRMDFGLVPGGLLDVSTTLCSEVQKTRRAVVIDCASRDAHYCSHHTPKAYGFESYISVPIFLPDGSYFGNICGLDSEPAELKNNETLAMFELYAELIGLQLDAEQRQESTRAALLDSRETGALREKFIAVLGHDMRTPLGAILSGTQLLRRRGELGASEHKVLDRMQASATRMARLVDDLLDFARGRLGSGIPLASVAIDNLANVFKQIIEEVEASHPGRVIRYCPVQVGRVHGDPGRLGQLLANLLGNALHHGSPEAPVDVIVKRDAQTIALIVSNRGEPIPEDVRERLFQPFFRGDSNDARSGLGLGLYIASEIVRSHGGRIEVRSSKDEGTSFVCTLPALS
jgi:phosphoserine phosphatase RsbU/P